ncbi:MAG: hypothetical protein R3F56_23835 [Planctomycetota bacterium]
MSSSAPTKLDKSFLDVLDSHVGHEFTIVNPQSYEETGLGHAIRPDWYKGKLVATGPDFVVLVVRYEHTGKDAVPEHAEQYVPLSQIKRISILKSGRFLHL